MPSIRCRSRSRAGRNRKRTNCRIVKDQIRGIQSFDQIRIGALKCIRPLLGVNRPRTIDSFGSFFGVENDRNIQVMPLSTRPRIRTCSPGFFDSIAERNRPHVRHRLPGHGHDHVRPGAIHPLELRHERTLPPPLADHLEAADASPVRAGPVRSRRRPRAGRRRSDRPVKSRHPAARTCPWSNQLRHDAGRACRRGSRSRRRNSARCGSPMRRVHADQPAATVEQRPAGIARD